MFSWSHTKSNVGGIHRAYTGRIAYYVVGPQSNTTTRQGIFKYIKLPKYTLFTQALLLHRAGRCECRHYYWPASVSSSFSDRFYRTLKYYQNLRIRLLSCLLLRLREVFHVAATQTRVAVCFCNGEKKTLPGREPISARQSKKPHADWLTANVFMFSYKWVKTF